MYQRQLCRQTGKQPIRALPCALLASYWACLHSNPSRIYTRTLLACLQDTLFYIFYSMPNDEAQLFAADELAHRGWWYHR